ncbi:MAG: DUF5682 family protein, partial [Actinomycetes bacterium]
ADVVHLMDALPPLARAARYGDVRGTDIAALGEVSRVLLLRICAGLSAALTGLDDDNAAALRRRVDAVHTAIGLLQADPAPWLGVLATCVDRAGIHGLLSGRLVRILTDADRLADAPVRLARALSYGVPAAAKAAWVDGFFADGALLLIHDAALRDLLDAWVSGLDDAEFTDVLPLIRRTFGTFGVNERRLIAARLAAGQAGRDREEEEEIDLDQAAPALATARLILEGG